MAGSASLGGKCFNGVIMIDHFNGIPAATKYISEMQGKLAISVITRAEVLTGFEGKDRQVASYKPRSRSITN